MFQVARVLKCISELCNALSESGSARKQRLEGAAESAAAMKDGCIYCLMQAIIIIVITANIHMYPYIYACTMEERYDNFEDACCQFLIMEPNDQLVEKCAWMQTLAQYIQVYEYLLLPDAGLTIITLLISI